MAILNVFINFIQVTMPRSDVILTDPDSDLYVSKRVAYAYPIQGEYSREKLMLRKIRSFIAFLEKRLKEQQPVSSGFIAIRDNYDGITRAAAFLWKVLGVYTSKYMSASRMLGHQLALAWVVASEPSFDAKRYARPERFMHDIADASVLFLPSTVYNWIPPEGAGRGPVPWHAPGCQGGALQRFKETLDA